MNAFILVMVLFTNSGVLTKAVPVSTIESCTQTGTEAIGALQGQEVNAGNDGEKALVLDAQFMCIQVDSKRHA